MVTTKRKRGAAALADARVIEIVGGPGGVSRSAVAELLDAREVLWGFTVRAVKVRYKQAVLGIGWAVVQPLAAAALFAVFLGRFASIPSEGVPYLLFALAGMVVWTYFSSAAGSGSESLVSQQPLLRKIYFPREVLPLSALTAALVDLVPGLATLAVAALLYGVAPSLPWLSVPLLVLVVVVFVAAFSLALSAVNVYYRDVKYALPFVLQLGLFASPVVYSLDLVPSRWRELYAIGNPVAAAIDGLRRAFVHQQWPDLSITLGALAWATVLLAVAYWFFKRLERGFSDRV